MFVAIKAMLLIFNIFWIVVAAENTNTLRKSGPQSPLHTMKFFSCQNVLGS